MGLEAYSRGAREVILIDRADGVVQHLHATVRDWGLRGATVIKADGLRWLAGTPQPFDIVFLDPPFASRDLLVNACARLANPMANPDWLAEGAKIYLEAPADDALSPALPSDWTITRRGRAGDVQFALVERQRTSH